MTNDDTRRKQQQRDQVGRYADDLTRVCVCGHTKGVHTAERAVVDGKPCQPCVDAGEPCDCEVFTRARTTKKAAKPRCPKHDWRFHGSYRDGKPGYMLRQYVEQRCANCGKVRRFRTD